MRPEQLDIAIKDYLMPYISILSTQRDEVWYTEVREEIRKRLEERDCLRRRLEERDRLLDKLCKAEMESFAGAGSNVAAHAFQNVRDFIRNEAKAFESLEMGGGDMARAPSGDASREGGQGG